MNCTTFSALSLVALLTLAACSPAPEKLAAEAAPATTAPAQTAAEEPATAPPLTQSLANAPALPNSFLPSITVSDLMKDTINPNVKALWEAVSYTVTEKGATDTKPTTDADWAALRVNADALIKAAGTLMLPALLISNDQKEAPDYQYSAMEIEQLRKKNSDVWREYSMRVQITTQTLIGDIEKRDVESYLEHGPAINQACEGCHAQFWYRPSQPRAQ